MVKVTITFGAFITLLRSNKNLSISELAETAGISRNYLSQIEHSADRQISVDMLLKLAKALSMKHTDLVNIYTLWRLGQKIEIEISQEETRHG